VVTMSIESLAKLVFLLAVSPPVFLMLGCVSVLAASASLLRTFGPEVVTRMIATWLPVPQQQADEMLSH
jgi:hypothetical protein